MDAFQVLSDCPDCQVSAAVVELLDPGLVEGVAIESTCRMCGRLERLGELEQAGRSFPDEAAARSALMAWAVAEGDPELDTFCTVNLCGLSPDEVCRRLVARQPIETSFDVVAYLFPGMGAGSYAPTPEPQPESVVPDFQAPPGPAAPTSSLPPANLQPPPFIAARALVAVMLADGVVRKGERNFIDGFLARAGLPPLEELDIRPWRPADLGLPVDPNPIIDAMVQVAFIDKQKDGSEWQVIREFARHWGYSLDRLEKTGARMDRKTSTAMQRLYRALKAIIITERA